MTNRNPIIRPAMAAIAAAIACSTPSFAQSADPPVTEAPAPVVAAPVAAEPVTATPIVPDTPVAAETPAPAEAVAAPATRTRTTTATRPARSRPAPARVAIAAPAAAAPAPAAASAAPVAEAPVGEPLPVPPEAAPVVAPAEAANTNMMDGMMLPLAAGGLAILLLAGALFALRRRKRHAAEADEIAMREAELAAIDDSGPGTIVEPEPVPEPVKVQPTFVAASAPATKTAPVIATAPAADPTPDVDGPVTELPEDFDLSRFGYNVQEAYKGPTQDNPSLSMKNRLTRARGMDQLERNLDAEVEAATGEPVLTEAELSPPAETPAAEPATSPLAKSDSTPSTPDHKPAERPV